MTERAFRRKCGKVMKSPKEMKGIQLVQDQLEAGEYPLKLRDCLFQNYQSSGLEAAYAFLQIYTAIMDRFAFIRVPVGKGPFSDSAIEENQSALEAVKKPFSATFVGGKQGADGSLSWSRPVHATIVDRESGEVSWILLEAFEDLAFEVGYYEDHKAVIDFLALGGVARWPYGQEEITAFVDLSKFRGYGPDDDGFEDALERSGESIEEAFEDGRDPWTFWI